MNFKIKTLKINRVLSAMFFIGLASVSSVSSAKHHGDDEQRGKRTATPEAIEACSDLAEGNTCEFEGRRGAVSGSCIVPPNTENILACQPIQRPRKAQERDISG